MLHNENRIVQCKLSMAIFPKEIKKKYPMVKIMAKKIVNFLFEIGNVNSF